MKKLYEIRKYVIAESIADALKVEKNQKADEVVIQDSQFGKFLTEKLPREAKEIGFKK